MLKPKRNSRFAVFHRPAFLAAVAALLLLSPASGRPDVPGQDCPAPTPHERGLEIVQHGGYPELRVDGVPFFVHSAAFFYYRIPADLWEISLDRHRELGINTIDLYIPWNWHEPREGQLDFEGRTNPRRDLRRLLRLITQKGFKLIARPGPVILNEWRHGGYPEWLLERPEYKMDAMDRIEGRYAPLTNLNVRDAEAAARGWMENATHMRYTRQWLAAVAAELVPYQPGRAVNVQRPNRKGDLEDLQVSGPLLFVQLDDDMAIGRTNYAGPDFWRYMQELRAMLRAGGLSVPDYINPTDMRVSAAGAAVEPPIGAMGQWYLYPPSAAEALAGTRRITPQDASTIEFFVETLKTQPAFPPMIIEYQAGWYTPGEDSRPPESSPANTLLSSRLLLSHGLKGLNYFPAQDGVTPAGYDTPWTNTHYRWDAALSAAAVRQPRARAIARNAQLMELWNEFLAASHKRADFGLIYPLGAFSQETLAREDIQRVSATVLRIARVAQLAGLAHEMLDPHYQPAEQLLRHPLVLLPVFGDGEVEDPPRAEKFQLSEKAQAAIVDYVRRGGTLAVFPARPRGRLLDAMWQSAPSAVAAPDSAVTAAWKFGQGRVLESTKDFYSWVVVSESYEANLARMEAAWSLRALRSFLERAGPAETATGVQPAVKREAGAAPALAAGVLVSNAGTQPLGAREAGRGMLSVTNLSNEETVEETLQLLSTKAGPAGRGSRYVPFRVSVPPQESLLLPFEQPLCLEETQNPPARRSAPRCEDEIVASGAEVLRAERDGRTLELTLYVPARATLLLRLARQPRRVMLDEIRPDGKWDTVTRVFEVTVPRGASPDFLRVLKVSLRYTPQVPEKPDRSKPLRRDYVTSIFDAVRLPLADDAALPTDPPLVLVSPEREGQFLVQATNYDDLGRDIDVRVEGPVRGSAGFGIGPGETRQVIVKLRAAKEAAAAQAQSNGSSNGQEKPAEGVLRSELLIRSGSDRRSSSIFFAPIPEEGTARYEFDFDRDADDEWVLENTGLRVIVSPQRGGRIFALVDKTHGMSLVTNVGGARDHFAFTPNPEGIRPERARGRSGLANRRYAAEWLEGGAMRLRYTAPEVFPAGAEVEKTIRMAEEDVIEVDYAVRLLAPSGDARPAQEQAFVAVNSLPVLLRGERSSRFCWPEADAAAPEMHCERFTPGGTLEVPAHARRLEMRTPGRFGIALEWDAGPQSPERAPTMTIEMKNFSAYLKLQFPPLEPGVAAGNYRVRYKMIDVD